jgi:hypothetical protein
MSLAGPNVRFKIPRTMGENRFHARWVAPLSPAIKARASALSSSGAPGRGLLGVLTARILVYRAVQVATDARAVREMHRAAWVAALCEGSRGGGCRSHPSAYNPPPDVNAPDDDLPAESRAPAPREPAAGEARRR